MSAGRNGPDVDPLPWPCGRPSRPSGAGAAVGRVEQQFFDEERLDRVAGDIPWNKRNDGVVDLNRIREVLHARQAGLDDAKATVIEYLAGLKRNARGTGAVLCFLGPPGVGKTSLAQSNRPGDGAAVLAAPVWRTP